MLQQAYNMAQSAGNFIKDSLEMAQVLPKPYNEEVTIDDLIANSINESEKNNFADIETRFNNIYKLNINKRDFIEKFTSQLNAKRVTLIEVNQVNDHLNLFSKKLAFENLLSSSITEINEENYADIITNITVQFASLYSDLNWEGFEEKYTEIYSKLNNTKYKKSFVVELILKLDDLIKQVENNSDLTKKLSDLMIFLPNPSDISEPLNSTQDEESQQIIPSIVSPSISPIQMPNTQVHQNISRALNIASQNIIKDNFFAGRLLGFFRPVNNFVTATIPSFTTNLLGWKRNKLIIAANPDISEVSDSKEHKNDQINLDKVAKKLDFSLIGASKSNFFARNFYRIIRPFNIFSNTTTDSNNENINLLPQYHSQIEEINKDAIQPTNSLPKPFDNIRTNTQIIDEEHNLKPKTPGKTQNNNISPIPDSPNEKTKKQDDDIKNDIPNSSIASKPADGVPQNKQDISPVSASMPTVNNEKSYGGEVVLGAAIIAGTITFAALALFAGVALPVALTFGGSALFASAAIGQTTRAVINSVQDSNHRDAVSKAQNQAHNPVIQA